jgi:hypothetical protein
MAGFLGSVFLGALGAFLIGEVIGGFVEQASGPLSPVLGFFVWPIGAVALPLYLYRRNKRRRRQ